jgi:pilus assembly protein CpaB
MVTKHIGKGEMGVRQRSGGMVILVVSIVAGLLAALMSVSFLRGVSRTTTVLVATKDIAAFAPLTADMFRLELQPSSAVPADAVTQSSALSGRYARTLILKDSIIRAGYLASGQGSTSSLAARLTETGPAGTRALAIPVDNATGVGGTIQPGDRVDIIAAVRIDSKTGPATTFSKIIARAVPVLLRTEADGSAKGTVVVQVTPSQTEEIAYAQLAGTIYLSTNPYRNDTESEKTQGVTPESFLARYGGR